MVIPMPFTRALFLYGDPIYIARDEDVEQARIRVEMALNSLAEAAEHDFDNLWIRQPTTDNREP
jgi:lysophospholipid acyltransferase (LPLAT)-like uncharacterized protein